MGQQHNWNVGFEEQGRVKLDDGGWSAQGVADPHVIDPWYPMGEIPADWYPCDTHPDADSLGPGAYPCKPYNKDEIQLALWEKEEGEKGDWVPTSLGEWAPSRVMEITKGGYDFAVWGWNYPLLVLVTMCSKCGCGIMGEVNVGMEGIDDLGSRSPAGEVWRPLPGEYSIKWYTMANASIWRGSGFPKDSFGRI